MTTENLDAAFPIAFVDQSKSQFDGDQIVELGLSIRDYFAARAMQSILTNLVDLRRDLKGEEIARGAYQIADAMIAQRERILNELLG